MCSEHSIKSEQKTLLAKLTQETEEMLPGVNQSPEAVSEPEVRGETKDGTRLTAPEKPNSSWLANDRLSQRSLTGPQVS